VAVTKNGYGLRFALAPHLEVSTRSGRKFARVGEGDEIVGARPAPDSSTLCVASFHGHQLVCDMDEVNLLANPGRGVTVIKMSEDDDYVVGFSVDEDLVVENQKGKQETIKALKKNRVSRGLKGTVIWTRKDRVARVVPPAVTVPALPQPTNGAQTPSGGKN
jgi:DNA gyrase subunit A